MDEGTLLDLFHGAKLESLPKFSDRPVDYVRCLRNFLNLPECSIHVGNSKIESSLALFKFICENLTNADPKLSMELRILLKVLLKYQKQAGQVVDYEKWVEFTLALPNGSKAQYLILEHIGEFVPSPTSWGLTEEFYNKAFARLQRSTDANPVSKCLASLLRYKGGRERAQSEVEAWLASWVPYFNTAILGQQRDNTMRYFLPLMIKQEHSCLEMLLKMVDSQDASAKVGILKAGQTAGASLDGLALSNIAEVLHHRDRTMRFEAFCLIFLSQKLSSQISSELYELLKSESASLFCEPTPKFRGEMKMGMNHFVDRIRASTYAAVRDAKGNDTTACRDAEKFIAWLIGFIRDCIRPLCPYRTLVTGCYLMDLLISSGLDPEVDASFLVKAPVSFPFKLNIFSEELILDLTSLVLSNYQDIRTSATQILGKIPKSRLETSYGTIQSYLGHKAHALLSGVRGRQADAGARTALLIYRMKLSPEEKSNFVETLINSLEQRVNQVRQSPSLMGTTDGSLHGYLAALALIITQGEFLQAESAQLLDILLRLVHSVWEVTEEILTYNAPEGNAPQTLNGADLTETLEEDLEDDESPSISGWQNTLSFAWRSLKESSELVSALAKVFPLTDRQLRSFCELLVIQLTTIRHKGAFASVAAPLKLVFTRCYQSSQENIRKYPKTCVFEQIELSKHDKRLITRRSAGLPLLATSYLQSLPEKESTEAELFFTYLFEMADTSTLHLDGANKLDLPQVHAFNCIRAIIRDAELTRVSGRIIERALMLSISAFDSTIWSIRNCAAMLFSSLHGRLFTPKCNFISGRSFFTRFPAMKHFLKKHLEKQLASNGSFESFYPVLALLLRLRPSQELSDLETYIPSMIILLSNKSWDIRKTAAAAIAFISNQDQKIEILRLLLDGCTVHDQNRLHGNLMAMLKLHEQSPDLTEIFFAQDSIQSILRELFVNNRCPETHLELTRLCRAIKCPIDQRVSRKDLGLSPSLVRVDKLMILESLSRKCDPTSSLVSLLGGSILEVESALEFLSSTGYNFFSFDVVQKLSAILCENCLPTYLQCSIVKSYGDRLSVNVDELNLLSQRIPSLLAKQKLLVRLAAVIRLGSPEEKNWWAQIREFSDEASAAESRLSCLHAIGAYLGKCKADPFSESTIKGFALMRMFKFLSDDEDNIREEAVGICSQYLTGAPCEVSVGYCEKLWLSEIEPSLALKLLQEKAFDSVADRAEDTGALFAIEDSNLFRDNYRYYDYIYQRAEMLPKERLMAESRDQSAFSGLNTEQILKYLKDRIAQKLAKGL